VQPEESRVGGVAELRLALVCYGGMARSTEADDYPWAAPVQALIESLASPMFHSPPRVYLLYLAVGVVMSLAWRRRAEPDPA
jgi:hypothetical protein